MRVVAAVVLLCLASAHSALRMSVTDELLPALYRQVAPVASMVARGKSAPLGVPYAEGENVLVFDHVTVNSMVLPAELDFSCYPTQKMCLSRVELDLVFEAKAIIGGIETPLDIEAVLVSENDGFELDIGVKNQRLDIRIVALTGKLADLRLTSKQSDVLNAFDQTKMRAQINSMNAMMLGLMREKMQQMLDKALDKVQYTTRCPMSGVNVDMHIVEFAKSANSITFGLNGSIFNDQGLVQTHTAPAPLPDFNPKSQIAFQVGDFMTNSMLAVAHQMGLMDFKKFPALPTKMTEMYLPGLSKLGPMARLALETPTAPRIFSTPAGLTASYSGLVTVTVGSETAFVSSFTLQMTISLNNKLQKHKFGVQVQVEDISLADLSFSQVSEGLALDAKEMQDTFNLLAAIGIEKANKMAPFKYYDIPPFVSLSHASVEIKYGAIESGAAFGIDQQYLLALWQE